MLKCFCEDPLTLEPDAEHWYATNCGHVFHYLCLTNWLERSQTCPHCREPVRPGQLFRLYPTTWDERPRDEINEALQICLDTTLQELDGMTALCQKKEGVIASLQGDADNDISFRRENKALKSILLTFDGDSLDEILDDENYFDEVLRGKVALIKLDEEAEKQALMRKQAAADAAAARLKAEAAKTNNTASQPRAGTSNANNTVTQPRAGTSNANNTASQPRAGMSNANNTLTQPQARAPNANNTVTQMRLGTPNSYNVGTESRRVANNVHGFDVDNIPDNIAHLTWPEDDGLPRIFPRPFRN